MESAPPPERLRFLQDLTNAMFSLPPAAAAGSAGGGLAGGAFNDAALLACLSRVAERASAAWSGDDLRAGGGPPPRRQPALPALLMRAVLLMLQGRAEARGTLVAIVGGTLHRLGGAAFEPIEPRIRAWAEGGGADGAVVWDGFVRVVKAAVPLSLELLARLPPEHLRLLLLGPGGKREAVLRSRFMAWFATWQGRGAAPSYVRAVVAEAQTAAATGGGGAGSDAALAVKVEGPAVKTEGGAT